MSKWVMARGRKASYDPARSDFRWPAGRIVGAPGGGNLAFGCPFSVEPKIAFIRAAPECRSARAARALQIREVSP